MRIRTLRARNTAFKVSLGAACYLLGAVILLPSLASAASKTYAIACVGSDVVVGKHSVSCSSSPAVPLLYAFSQNPKKPYPQGYGITALTVDCGRSTPNTPIINQPVKFTCHNGSKPTLKNAKVLQHGSGGHGAPSPPPPTPTQPSGCSAKGCDLVATYINPGINLLSAAFGLIAVISLIMGGIQFSMSEGDPQKASQAKSRISNTIIAIVAYSLLYGFLQFLIPGGIFH